MVGVCRAILAKDVTWTMAFSEVNANGVREVETLIRDFEAVGRELDEAMRALGSDPERFTEQARRYLAGLPSDLSPEEIAVLEDP